MRQDKTMNDLNLLFTQKTFLLILLINLIPIIILFFLIPINLFRRHQSLLTVFLSFASGGLMADVFLRLLLYMIVSYKNPIESHSHNHGDSRTGLVILLGIFLSFFTEKFFRHIQSTFYIKKSNFFIFLFFSCIKIIMKTKKRQTQH